MRWGRAVEGDEVWVAEGRYAPTGVVDPAATFTVPDGVALYGGFAGHEEERADRDYAGNTTVLTGDLGEPPEYGTVSYVVLTLESCGPETRVDGFTIRDSGKGLQITNSSPLIENTVVAHNNAYWGSSLQGGGAQISGESRPIFRNVEFISNRAYYGGGVAGRPTGGISGLNSAVFEDVLFAENGAQFSGAVYGLEGCEFRGVEFRRNGSSELGAVSATGSVFEGVDFIQNTCGYSQPGYAAALVGRHELRNVSFINNELQGLAGGSAFRGGGTLTNVLFEGNAGGSGAMLDRHGGSVLVNVAFVNNEDGALWVGEAPRPLATPHVVERIQPTALVNVTFGGNGAFSHFHPHDSEQPYFPPPASAIVALGSDVEMRNSILWGNERVGGGQFPSVFTELASLTISSSTVEFDGEPGVGNLGADPQFQDPDGGDLRLGPESPAVDAGQSAALPAEVMLDLDGNPRIIGTAVDMGAYEHQGSVGIGELPKAPQLTHYLYASPNPFNPSTTIRYGLEEAGLVTLVIYDLAGRHVKTLVSGNARAGDHQANWDGRDARGGRVASGTYLARLTTAGVDEAVRLVLLK